MGSVHSNLSKIQNLGVEAQIIEKFGAVSQEVAGQMAIGAIKNSDANLSIATTGVAAPEGSEKIIKQAVIMSINFVI